MNSEMAYFTADSGFDEALVQRTPALKKTTIVPLSCELSALMAIK